MKTTKWRDVAILLFGMATTAGLQAASTIQFTRSSTSVAESEGSVAVNVQRTGDFNSEARVDYATANGTANDGFKFVAASGTLAFGVGETNKSIVITILNNGVIDANRNFHVLLSNPTVGAALGANTNLNVVITDSDLGIQFQFAATSVMENAGNALLGVVRGDDGVLPVTIGFYTTEVTARSGIDFTGVNSRLSFAPQERLKFISIPILNNILKQGDRTFVVTLTDPRGATAGTQMTNKVTIIDNDQGFQFEATSYSVAADAGVASLRVLRGTDDTNSTTTVDFAASDLTATNGLDYSTRSQTLSFAPGEQTKVVRVLILNDAALEPSKKFSITLSSPSGGAVLRSGPPATVTIEQNGTGFEFATYSVSENAGAISLTVLRGNDLGLGSVALDYATSDLSAVAGQDYQAVSGTIKFEDNETAKSISIPILRNESVVKSTSFGISLSNPARGAASGRTNTHVNIINAPEAGTVHAVAPPFDTGLNMGRDGEFNILTWIGGGQLRRADSFGGPWRILPKANSPYLVRPVFRSAFYQVTRPRPANVYIPSGYDGKIRVPLVLLLHGHGGASGTADFEESYMRLRPLAERRGFLYCTPEGTVGQGNDQFWNATDGCCDFFNAGTDDAGYLRTLIKEICTQYAVDPKRIYLVGHSNGAFMAYRMACESADIIAGIVSLAGTTFLDPSRCVPSQPVNILHIHGTADTGVPYAGGANQIFPPYEPSNMAAFPGALQTIRYWAAYNGANGPVTDGTPSLDLTTEVAGLDTVITRYLNYPPGGAVELWTINGASHYPILTPEFPSCIIEWLLAHPKP